ncbi:MAG: hypothetical protein O3A53_04640 [Acidobacteria bacterium]|nr:hypothetical protein [Acidobacteriota bacterium]MDA1234068.1 hypothetical protein [Acidobacteriota bacterium]
MKRPATIFGTLAISTAAIIGLLSSIEGDHASDKVLIQHLERRAADFERLVAMFQQDNRASVVDYTHVQPDGVITVEQWDDYKALFDELELKGGVRRSEGQGPGTVWLVSTFQGFVTHGSSKGFLYQPTNSAPLYPSLDEMSENREGLGIGYRKIDEEWYLVFGRD